MSSGRTIFGVANTQSNYCTHICCCGLPVKPANLITGTPDTLGPSSHRALDTPVRIEGFHIKTLSIPHVFPSEPPDEEICDVKEVKPLWSLAEEEG